MQKSLLSDRGSREPLLRGLVAASQSVESILGSHCGRVEFSQTALDAIIQGRDRHYSNPNHFFPAVQKAMKVPAANSGYGSTLRLISGLDQKARRCSQLITHYAQQPLEDLMAAAISCFDFEFRSLLELSPEADQIYIKVNHGYWEHFANCYSEMPLGEGFRPIPVDGMRRRYVDSGFDQFFMLALLQHIEQSHSGGEILNLTLPSCQFALSITAGERTMAATFARPVSNISEPARAIQKGALVGSLSFWKGVTGKEQFRFGDGASAKQLVGANDLVRFFDLVAGNSDVVLFIVPNHLREIDLSDRRGAQVCVLPIPSELVHESWFPVLCACLHTIDVLLQQFDRVSVVTQSAVFSAPLGLCARKLKAARFAGPHKRFRFYDLGRVLDVATPERLLRQSWSKKLAFEERIDSPFVQQP